MELIRTDTDHLTQEVLQEVLDLTETPCLSIYMPTHRRGAEIEQDPIRLKNLVGVIETILLARTELRRPDVNALLEPLQTLQEDREFWRHQNDGLAIFRTVDHFATYRLPLTFSELQVISNRPHVKPLLPLLTANGHFYLLALSQNQVRFFEGTRLQMGEIDLPDTPTSLAEAMRFDEFEDQLQFHTQTGTNANGGRAAIFHGHSDAGDSVVIKENLKRFLQQVDDGVRDRINGEQAPLVLAGVEMIYGLYNEITSYANLVESRIEGNPEMLSPQELHEQAWPLVEPRFTQRQQQAVDDYLQLAGTDSARASSDLSTIVSAAYFQRVDTLFAPLDVEQWGSFDAEANQTQLHDEQQGNDFDLFDFAALHTLLNGGSVYVVPSEEVPGDGMVAAIFRYG